MFLPLELAPIIFQFLPVETLRKFPQNDPLLIAVLKIQDGCRPFRVYCQYFTTTGLCQTVDHMGFNLNGAFSKEVLSSLGVVHRIDFTSHMSDKFASMFVKNDKADDSFPFPRAEVIEVSCKHWKFSRIDLSMFPKLRELHLYGAQKKGITISPRSRTMLLSYISGLPGGGCTVDGVCDISSDVDRGSIEINIDRSHRFIVLTHACVDWKPCFDRSWCRSIELQKVSYSKHTLATLEGFPNLKDLKFVEAKIELSQDWLPNLPLEALSFRCCRIRGTELGFWTLVKELELRFCMMEPLKGHFPQLESFIFLDVGINRYTGAEYEENEPNYPLISAPIAKENLIKVKSFSLLTQARRFDMSSFKELKDLEVSCSYQITRLDGLNVETLERVTIESCPELKVDFPCHVSVT